MDTQDIVRICPLYKENIWKADREATKFIGMQRVIFVPRVASDAIQQRWDAVFNDAAYECCRLGKVFQVAGEGESKILDDSALKGK